MEEITFEVSVCPFSLEGLKYFIQDIENMNEYQRENVYDDLIASADKYQDRALEHFEKGNEGEYIADLIYASRSLTFARIINEKDIAVSHFNVMAMIANVGSGDSNYIRT